MFNTRLLKIGAEDEALLCTGLEFDCTKIVQVNLELSKSLLIPLSLLLRELILSVRKGEKHREVPVFFISVEEHLFNHCEDLVSKT